MPTPVAFVTGASSGIGYATALAFARANTHVVAVARRADRLAQLEQAVEELPQPHGEILTAVADVTDRASLQTAVDAAVARFGRLDILVANAGVGQRGSMVDADWKHLKTVMRTNMDGVLHSILAVAPAMRASGGGHIVIVSSVQATMTAPYTAVYAASKAFASSLAASLQLELADDHITVTDVRVGRTVTEFNEKRLGKSGRAATSIAPSSMSADKVAAAIVRAVDRRQKVVVLRLIDRLILLGNRLLPGLVGRLAIRQYK